MLKVYSEFIDEIWRRWWWLQLNWMGVSQQPSKQDDEAHFFAAASLGS